MYRLGIGSLLLLGLVFTFSLQGAEPERLAVMLDWLPNPNHVPLYVAQAEGVLR
jgi:ABC-type nitrate/sulfonate/bicarbonate transport system substrate-binding protein